MLAWTSSVHFTPALSSMSFRPRQRGPIGEPCTDQPEREKDCRRRDVPEPERGREPGQEADRRHHTAPPRSHLSRAYPLLHFLGRPVRLTFVAHRSPSLVSIRTSRSPCSAM